MLATNRRKGDRSLEKYLPVGYFALVLAIVLVVLPSVLRQQPPTQNNTEALSPNAPNNHQTSIIAALHAASSGTAGIGNGIGNQGPPGLGGNGPGGGGASNVPRSCPFGFGNPPRQTFSVYSAPCAAAWHGNNGGATYQGVTDDTVRIAVGDPDTGWGTDGPVPTTVTSNESAGERTLTVIQDWLNSRYQFYGRRLQFYLVNGSETPSNEVAAADEAADEWHVFGGAEGREATMTEFARQKMVDFGDTIDQLPASYYNSHDPWLYGIGMDSTELSQLDAEMICKQLWGRNASYAGDPTMQTQKRKLGLMILDDGSYSQVQGMMQQDMAQDCGASFAAVVGFHSSTVVGAEGDQQATATAVAKMRAAGVTTVVSAIDWVTAIAVTNEAAGEGYVPEWYYSGAGSIDNNGTSRDQNQTEWGHAFGVTSFEIPRPLQDTDCYRVYVSIDPSNTPDSLVCSNHFFEYVEIANAIQQAGPHLTPQTFQQGLFSMGIRPPNPNWSIGGGFGPDHHSYADVVSIIWWNPSATAVDGNAGSWEYVENGARYAPGQIPTGDLGLFKSGITQAPSDTG